MVNHLDLPPPPIFYDPTTGGKSYYVTDDRGNYIAITESNAKSYLKRNGFSDKVEEGEMLSELDDHMIDIRTNANVEYAGPLAGAQTGVRMVEHRRVLVTEPPIFIMPSKLGSYVGSTLETVLKNLLGEDQLPYFYGWLKVGITALRAGRRRPGQALVIAGPAGCGKSLVQNMITKLLGGRSAKPYQYMTGGTAFNSELFTAEHLMIEDEAASFDLRIRRALGNNIKGCVVNESQRCHPKNRQALTLYPFWRLSITLNDEAESLIVLPPLDESLQDKMMLLRAFKHDMPMPTDTLEQWAAFSALLELELTYFIEYLLNQWAVPGDLRCGRYGVKHYHNAELLQMMSVLAPETKLMELLDSELWKESKAPSGLRMKASEIESKLCGEGSGCSHEARKLFLYQNACGTYMGRLEKIHPDRIGRTLLHGTTIWEIEPPESMVT